MFKYELVQDSSKPVLREILSQGERFVGHTSKAC